MLNKNDESIGQFRSAEFKKDTEGNTKHIVIATIIAALVALGVYEVNSASPSTPTPTKVAK